MGIRRSSVRFALALLSAIVALPSGSRAGAASPAGERQIEVRHDPGFALFQNSPRLADLFKPGEDFSALCGVTALAHAMLYQRRFRRPAFPTLKGTGDRDGNGREDGYDLVRYFKHACHTSLETGTWDHWIARCARGYYSASGFPQPPVLQIAQRFLPREKQLLDLPGLRTLERDPTWEDLKAAVDRDAGILLGLVWWNQDAQGRWREKGGHFVSVYGYSERPGPRGTVKRHLFIFDPWVNYRGRTNPQTAVEIERYDGLFRGLMLKYPATRDAHASWGEIRTLTVFLPR